MSAVNERSVTAPPVSGGSPAPLRGTQSFVAVMGTVWKRPALVGLELLWRWCAGLPLLLLAWWAGRHALRGVHADLAALEAISLFRPANGVGTLAAQLGAVIPPLIPVFRWFVPLAIIVWACASASGRTAILRRLDPALGPKPGILGALGLTRAVALLGVLALWVWGLTAAARYTVTAPVSAGAEPNLVLYTALAVGLTLLLFMFWAMTVWVLDAAPLFAMAQGMGVAASLRSAFASVPLRSKLIETNLVMGIVKVCLLVLAMVFSASPLPFESVETQSFLLGWWVFVATLYLVASDLFQVIRRAAYLSLFRALVPSFSGTTPAPGRAS